MQDAMFALQPVVYAKFVGAAALVALIAKDRRDGTNATPAVLDSLSPNQPFPYVTIGELDSVPYRTKSRPGENMEFHVHVYDQDDDKATGSKVALSIVSEVKKLLGDVNDLVVSGWEFIGSWFDRTTVVKEVDSAGVVTRNYDVTFRVRMLQNEA